MQTSGAPLPRGLFYVAGDIADPAFTAAWRSKLDGDRQAERPTGGNVLFYLSTQPSQYAPAAQGLGAAGLAQGAGLAAAGGGKTFRPRPRQRPRTERPPARSLSTNATSTASIITWARRPSRTSWPSASATAFSSRCGTAATSTTCRSRRRNPSASRAAAPITRKPARCADMIQNHLLQVMATIAMEPSASFRADSVRDERSKLLRSIRIMTPDEIRDNTVAGQYGPARIGGEDVPGFRAGDRASTRTRRPTPMRPPPSSSRTGAGRACRSTCAPASGCPSGSPKSPSSSSRRRSPCSMATAMAGTAAQPADRAHPARRGHLAASFSPSVPARA